LHDFPPVLHPGPAAGTLYPPPRTAGEIEFGDHYLDFLYLKKLLVWHHAVGFKLASVFVRNFREVAFGKLPGLLPGNDAIGLAGLKVDEGGSHDAVIHKFE